jgi:hypothetical protein
MAQRVSHMRQRVGTTPDGTTVLTFIAVVILCETGSSGSTSCHFFPFEGCQIVDVAVMQGEAHAVLNTLRIPRTQIALGGNSPPSFEMDATEGTGMDTHFASQAGGLIHDYRPCGRIPAYGRCGTYLQTDGRFALLTGHGKN